MRVVFINPERRAAEVLDIRDELSEFYRLIGCDCIDIVSRSIGGVEFDIICDDEGLFAESPRISAVDRLGNVMLVGSLIVTGPADEDGNLTDLTPEQARRIAKRAKIIETKLHPEGLLILTDVGYC